MLVVNPDLQHSGLSAQLLANAIPGYRGLKIQCIQLDAGLSAGGSVWPKFGFQPVTEKEWRSIHPRIRKNLAKLDAGVTTYYQQNYGKDLAQVIDSLLDKPVHGESEETALSKDLAELDRQDPNWYRPNLIIGARQMLMNGNDDSTVSAVYGAEITAEAKSQHSATSSEQRVGVSS
jgi:hypothetical protein